MSLQTFYFSTFAKTTFRHLHLEKLILTNFKNYASQQVDCSTTLNCFVGLNGMGKTNLLDAIYYLCMGKSHFNAPDGLVMQHDADFFRLEGLFLLNDKKEKIVAKVIPRKKKEFERNGLPYPKLSEHIGLLPVVMITPKDTDLVADGSEVRRRFIDNTLSQLAPKYLEQLILYNTVLKQRNAALKQFGETQTFNLNLLQTYNQQLISPAGIIFEHRKSFIERFRPIFLEMYKFISGKSESVDCRFLSQLNEQSFELLLDHAQEKDRVLQRTTVGPHKDDLHFSIEKYPLKRFGSQGQLKSYVLALKLAQYEMLKQEKKCSPILLLDDIFDKLDRNRVRQLLQLLLQGDFGQIFITDTHESRVEEIVKGFSSDYRLFRVQQGSAELFN